MKHLLLLIIALTSPILISAQTQNDVSFATSPSAFEENEQVTITVSGLDAGVWGSTTPANIYLWAWYFDTNGNEAGDSPTNGTWGDSNEAQRFTNNGDGTYSFTLTPTILFGTTGISQMGMLIKSDDGAQQSQDQLVYVGKVTVLFNNPTSSTVVVGNGGSLPVSAYMVSGGSSQVGNFEIFYNNVSQNTGTGFPNYGYTLNNITQSGTVRVEGTPFGSPDTGEATFEVIVANQVTEAMPAGLEDGINYDPTDPTKATLVLDAPNKDFIYVAGSFNNWDPYASHLMKKNTSGTKFWLELTGLTPGQEYTYQYWVYANSPASGSPTEVKTADPYSTLVLSPFDDPYIPASTYPNLPTYPAGQEREVTVLQTNQTPYNWQVANFTKPKKEDLIIHEVLIRDFDVNRNFQDLIDHVDYFKNLNVNAVQLMPIMEFEGNESWGYNTSFHMALDKYYGTKDKFKEMVDLYHQNGIAVILDLALNHAFGRNPMVRMWMDDPDNNGWGEPSSENPYLNEIAAHSYSVGSDFNHQSTRTQYYTERVIKHWIEEYKIDGFRWDLTKGFTQNCTNNEGCTNGYQQDRVDVLKAYADYSWSIDPTHYVIFEHLGQDGEESQWANHGQGIMMWGKMTNEYNQLTMGYGDNSNFNRVGHQSRGFNQPRLVGYAESHDEERLMYRNLQFGNQSNSAHNVRNLDVALSRMSAQAAMMIPVPGPKMIWHFGDLGNETSIYTCTNGTVNTPGDATPGDCKLDTKPQLQWTQDWLNDTNRSEIYNNWSRLHKLKIEEDVFEGNYAINSGNLTPRIYVWDDALPASQLKNVVVLANFNVNTVNVTADFPYTGTWFDLMDNTGVTSMNVTNTAMQISIPAGGFRIFGNKAATLSTEGFTIASPELALYPNPAQSAFSINKDVKQLRIYDVSGKQVKHFKGNFFKGHEFGIESLTQGMYFVETINNSGAITTTKLIKL